MNISSNFNSQPRQSFTGFNRPNGEVIAHFKQVITDLKPDQRDAFVTEMGKIVRSASGNPVPIEQSIHKGSVNTYVATVGNGNYFMNGNPTADGVLTTMKRAVEVADDILNISQNMTKIKKIFE